MVGSKIVSEEVVLHVNSSDDEFSEQYSAPVNERERPGDIGNILGDEFKEATEKQHAR